MQLDAIPVSSEVNNLILQYLQAASGSGFVAYAIEAMKRSKYFPWLTKERTTLLRVMSGIGSALSAVGIGVATQWSKGNNGSLTVVFSGLCFSCIVHSGYAWARSWLFTQAIYDGLISKKTADPAKVQLVEPVVVPAEPAPAKEATPAKEVAPTYEQLLSKLKGEGKS